MPVDTPTQTEAPTRKYEEEITVQMAVAKKAKDQYEAAKAKTNQLRA